jgi:hypothetical protein
LVTSYEVGTVHVWVAYVEFTFIDVYRIGRIDKKGKVKVLKKGGQKENEK